MKKNLFVTRRCQKNPHLRKILMTMKLMTVMFFLAISNLMATEAYSQNARLTLHLEDATVKEVLSKIEDNSEFFFLYNGKLVDVNRKVSVDATDEKISGILSDLFRENDVCWSVVDRQIVLTDKANKSSFANIGSQQQQKITGTVTDEKGNPLPGVTVLIKGTTFGTLTDASGKYTFDNPPKNPTLNFSFVGMATQEIASDGRMLIDVVLKEAAIGLNEVVVVGYGTQKKINMTGSVATIKTDDFKSLPVTSITSGLIGRLPGLVSVDRGGIPGSSPSISIRGFSNMLVIVDGVENSFNNIDPNEIDNVTILKDASSAIYGARAGNGVMLITTKRGKSGTPTFDFSAYYGVQQPTRIDEQVDAATFAKMTNDAEIEAGRPKKYTDAEIEKFKNGSDPVNYPNTNWRKEVMRNSAPISKYNLNVSGNNEKVGYFFSLGYLNQEGLLKSGDIGFQRYNLRSNIDAKISNSFTISLSLSGRLENTYQPGGNIGQIQEDIFYCSPIYTAHYPDPTKLAYTGHLATQPIGRSSTDFSGYQKDYKSYIDAILTLKYDVPFIKGLSAKALLSSNMINDYNKNWGKAFYYYNYDQASNTYTLGGLAQGSKTQLTETMNRSNDFTSQIHLNYIKLIGKHEIAALVVGEFIQQGGNYFNGHREGYLSTSIDQLFAGSDLNKNGNGSQTQDGRIGYVGRINYSYASKYLAEVSMRYDASARYSPEKRWGFFPSLSLGWRISEEKFLKDISTIDNLKLRASIGKAGNDYVSQYNFLTGYNYGGNNVFGESPVIEKGIVSKGLANPDLTWENTTTSNIGLDGSLWKNLLSFEFDLFYRKVTNVAGYRNESLPYSFGASLPLENINSYDNRGFELVLKHEKKFNEFRYSIEGNVAYSRAKWIHYDEPVYPDAATRDRLQLSGQWQNRYFGYTALGLFQSQAEIDNWPVIQDNNDNTTLKPGDIKYADYNHDGKLNYLDNHVIGRGFVPDLTFGLNLNFEFKGFDLSMLWQGASDFNAYFSDYLANPFTNGSTPFIGMSDYWTPENLSSKYPRIVYGGAPNNKYTSTYWLMDASYLRLKNIQVGYTIPKSICMKMHINSLRLYLAAFNIITLTKVSPLDPESGQLSNNKVYPQQKSVNIGIHMSF